jgi:hypothetical protein
MTITDRITRVWDTTVAGFQNTVDIPPRWQNPQESIGAFCRELGSKRCWELIGPGLERYQTLAGEIKEYLEQYSETETAIVHWSAYMVGRSTRSANPTVFFCSRQAGPRQRVRRVVEESGILRRHMYQGFKTGDSTRPPGFGKLVTLAGSDNNKPVASTCTCGSPTGVSISIHPAQSDQATHHAQNVATVGAIILFGKTLCFTTAAHAFRTEDIGFNSEDDSEFEFDIGDGDNDSEAGSACASPQIEQTSNLQDSTVTALGNPPVQPENKSQSILQSGSQVFFKEEDIEFSSLGTANPFLDYALVILKPRDSRLRQNKAVRVGSCDYHRAFPTDVASLNRGGAVIAFTGSGQITGMLSQAPSFMTSLASHVTQELWIVKFAAKSLARGVCGSMVVDSATGEYVGHIIAGDPLSGSALIVPASHVLDDIRERSKKIVSLANGTESVEGLSRTDQANTSPVRETHSELPTTRSNDKEKVQTSGDKGHTNAVDDLFAGGLDASIELAERGRTTLRTAIAARHRGLVARLNVAEAERPWGKKLLPTEMTGSNNLDGVDPTESGKLESRAPRVMKRYVFVLFLLLLMCTITMLYTAQYQLTLICRQCTAARCFGQEYPCPASGRPLQGRARQRP